MLVFAVALISEAGAFVPTVSKMSAGGGGGLGEGGGGDGFGDGDGGGGDGGGLLGGALTTTTVTWLKSTVSSSLITHSLYVLGCKTNVPLNSPSRIADVPAANGGEPHSPSTGDQTRRSPTRKMF